VLTVLASEPWASRGVDVIAPLDARAMDAFVYLVRRNCQGILLQRIWKHVTRGLPDRDWDGGDRIDPGVVKTATC